MNIRRFGMSGDEIEKGLKLGPDPGVEPDLGPAIFAFSDDETGDDLTADQWLAMSDDQALRVIGEQIGATGDDAERILQMVRQDKRVTAADFPHLFT